MLGPIGNCSTYEVFIRIDTMIHVRNVSRLIRHYENIKDLTQILG